MSGVSTVDFRKHPSVWNVHDAAMLLLLTKLPLLHFPSPNGLLQLHHSLCTRPGMTRGPPLDVAAYTMHHTPCNRHVYDSCAMLFSWPCHRICHSLSMGLACQIMFQTLTAESNWPNWLNLMDTQGYLSAYPGPQYDAATLINHNDLAAEV